ncbi:MAG TPA: glycosyltransferase [Chryseolinea sp.]|nr:glycosyltransferase [Chryseolinea sp.]
MGTIDSITKSSTSTKPNHPITQSPNHPILTAVIITYNEEKHIARCIDSVAPVADEIIVVDSFSKDATKSICLEKGVRFIEHAFTTHIDQKNYAIACADSDFILSIDGDEYLSEELIASILQVKKSWPCPAYTMNRLNQYGSKWIRHGSWYPDKKIRLWDRRKGVFGGLNPHDQVMLEPGTRVMRLRGELMHLAYQNASQLINKAQQYSSIFAEQNAFRKKVSTIKIIYKTFFSFLKGYVLKAGFVDGYEGLVIARSTANGVFYKYSKLLEANRSLKVSLIITTYNRKDALEAVLNSALHLDPQPDEIIVADDGSTADTREVVEKFVPRFTIPLRHCWHEDEGFRLAAIRNKAIAMASHPYIVLVDGDMIMPAQFIGDHKAAAWQGRLVQASRVLLDERSTGAAIQQGKVKFNFFDAGIGNRKNTISSRLLSSIFSHYSTNIYRVRGANLAFWKSDVVLVNGFNEDFAGWGREDSEFVVRMGNRGIRKFHLKFAGFAYHLYHKENTRDLLQRNQAIVDEAIRQKSSYCDNGIKKYLVANSK